MVTGAAILVILAGGCLFDGQDDQGKINWTQRRLESLPQVSKILPEDDLFPPVIHDDGWEEPVPIGSPINTAGAEDSPFILPGGEAFYFFFTPDVGIPPAKQISDGVTGIWVCERKDGRWSAPEKVVLSNDISLDGCAFVLDDRMWFASVRAGNVREIDYYVADLVEGRWRNWRRAGEDINGRQIGELHISSDLTALYFGSGMPGGHGGRDLWICEGTDGGWSDPVNLGPTVNSEGDEDQPFLTRDGRELWFTGTSRLGYPGPAVFRSLREEGGGWGEPQEVISRFAGEPCLDADGNIYFVHHFYSSESEMLEADIYVAWRR